MTTQVRRTAVIMLALFGALFVNLNVIQLLRADDLAANPANRRVLISEYSIERGPIVAGDQEVAHSVPTDDDLEYLRVYEEPSLWAHVTGYYSFVVGSSGIERALTEALIGTPTELLSQNLAELLGGRDEVGNTVRLTHDLRVQQIAARALGDRTGAVVALDPRSGAVLASVSNPSFDPNRLASHDASEILANWDELQDAPGQPLLDRVTRAAFPPGSTFKLLVAAAALERGLPPDAGLDNPPEYVPPQTSRPIQNFSPGRCADGGQTITLAAALQVSCNAAFAKLGVELGAESLADTAASFGFGESPPFETPVLPSVFPTDGLDDPGLAQSAIGQRDVRATPLQMAMVVAAIANDGVVMRPHAVAEVLDPSGRVLRRAEAGRWTDVGDGGRAVSPRTAELLGEMMVGVVDDGTGTAAQIGGVDVGGKTGTAQVPDQSPTVWFAGFAEDQVAVAVVLPDAGGDATGGGQAAPIAQAVMEAALGRR